MVYRLSLTEAWSGRLSLSGAFSSLCFRGDRKDSVQYKLLITQDVFVLLQAAAGCCVH